MVFMKRASATWRVELWSDCPYCHNYVQCFKYWAEQEGNYYVKVGESKQLKTTHGNEDLICLCDECNKEFVISETEY